MKLLLLPAFVLSLLLWSSAAAADTPREASEILKEYREIKMPTVDPAKVRDPEWVRSFREEQAKAIEKQNALALELYKAHPQNPEAAQLMAIRLSNMLIGNDGDKAVADVEEFLRANPKNDLGARLLSMMAMRSQDKNERLKIYKRIVADYPDSDSARMAEGSIRQTEAIGKPFDLSFTDAIKGDTVSIKDLKGKVVVIDFWATWCGPCVGEMPKMKELYAKYKPEGVEFIGVSLDQPGDGLDKLKSFVEEEKISWPQYYMGKGWESEFSQSWGISGIPTVFIVDANGNLYSTEARGQLERLIPELLKKRDEKS